MRIKALVTAALFATVGVSAGHAGTVSISQGGQSLNVNASIIPSCILQSGSAIAFGSITSLASPIDQAGSVNVNCDNGVDYAIGLGLGSNASGSQRRMSQTVNVNGTPTTYYLPYEIYADAGHTTPITDIQLGSSTTGSASASTPGGTGTGSIVNVPVYGRVLSGTKPWPGTYSDTVAITVGY